MSECKKCAQPAPLVLCEDCALTMLRQIEEYERTAVPAAAIAELREAHREYERLVATHGGAAPRVCPGLPAIFKAADRLMKAIRAVVGEQSGGIQSQEDNCKPAPEKEGG